MDAPAAASQPGPRRRNAQAEDHCRADRPHTDHMVDTLRRWFDGKKLAVSDTKIGDENLTSLHRAQKLMSNQNRLQGIGGDIKV